MDTAQSACSTCDELLPEGAAFCPACGAPTPTGTSQETGPPHITVDKAEFRKHLRGALGKSYKLGRLVGSGGFAEVYAAQDLRLKREVAVKVLRSELVPSTTALERFQREAEAIAQLRHPNIIPIYAVGEGEGLVYFVMPLIKGESLEKTLQREKRIPVQEVQRILREAAGALQEAHEAGIVHRDIKPANIMLEGTKRRVLVMDFGIAKAIGIQSEGLTLTGVIVGTPEYMSPEQASGLGEIDHRTDQYGLAQVGYRMLTGVLPFAGMTPESLIYQRMFKAPRAAHTVQRDVPRRLSMVLQRAMATDPNERFDSIEEFAAAVAPPQAVDTGAPILREEPSEMADLAGPTISVRVAALGVVGLLAFLLLYRVAFPPALGRPEITQVEALAVGREFLKEMGAAGSFKEAVQFDDEQPQRQFLERTLGTAEARRWIEEERLVGRWHLRWFRPREVEEWTVAVSGDGRVTQLTHTIEETAPGANLDQEAALAVADSFLLARGWDLDELEILESSSRRRANRTDYQLTLEKRESTIMTLRDVERLLDLTLGEADVEAGTGSVRVSVDIQGDRIGRYSHSLHVPEDFGRELEAGENIHRVFQGIALAGWFLLALGIVVAQIARRRAREFRWMTALIVSALSGIVLAVQRLNGWPGTRFGYSTDDAWVLFVLNEVGPLLLGGVLIVGPLLVVATAGEYLARQTFPKSLAGYREAVRGRLLTPAMVRAGATGSALGLVLLGYKSIFQAAASKLPGVRELSTAGPQFLSFTPSSYTGYLDQYAPVISGFFGAVMAGILTGLLIFFSVPLLKRYLTSTAIAVLIPAVLVGLLAPHIYPTYVGAPGVAVEILILGLVFVHFGVLTCIVAAYVAASVSSSMLMLSSGEPGLVTSGIVLLFLALLPASLVVISRSRAARAPAMAG